MNAAQDFAGSATRGAPAPDTFLLSGGTERTLTMDPSPEQMLVEVRALRAEVAALRAERALGTASPEAQVTDVADPISRRRLLRAAGGTVAAGVGLAAGSTMAASPAGAAPGDPVILGASNDAGNSQTSVIAGRTGPVMFVSNVGPDVGLWGAVSPGTATGADEGSGVLGTRSDVRLAHPPAGVCGYSESDTGVAGVSRQNTGVSGESNSGYGVTGHSITSHGVHGSGTGAGAGVFGLNDFGGGSGVVGKTLGSLRAAVLGDSDDAGPGVRGVSDKGRGGTFAGSAAQVRLEPGSRTTHPTVGQTGDLYLDRRGRLWFCKQGGSPSTWRQLA